MPNLKWDHLNSMQIGRYAEYYAKMELASYGFEIYTSEVDDHGVDFIAKSNRDFYEIQVKSLRTEKKSNYTYVEKTKMDINDRCRFICFLYFTNMQLPEVYLIPATAWKNTNEVLVDREYNKPGQKSKPEWGISLSKKNKGLLDNYKIENYIDNLKTS